LSAYSDSLIETARVLARHDPGRPRRSNLNRAVSTAYYATFSALADTCARALVGQPGPGQPSDPWALAYRGLNHAEASERLVRAAKTSEFGLAITTFAAAFAKLQGFRHRADYDPRYRVSRAEALRHINEAENAILALAGAETADTQHMAVALLVRSRR
jgi:hypothetical protein